MTARCVTPERPHGCHDCVECLSALPVGQTCATCAHALHCKAFGFTSSDANAYCSFVPSRFQWRATSSVSQEETT